MRAIPWMAACLSLTALLFSCSDGGGGGGGGGETGRLLIQATDMPFAHGLVNVARVQVDEIRVHQEATATSGFLTVYSGTPIEIDLLALNNGATQLLVDAELPVGTYRQLRLHVVSGHLELTDGDIFSTALGNLHLTSTGTSGLKVFVTPPVQVVSELARTLLLDFDLTKSFKPVPADDPFNASFYQLKPTVRGINLSMAGEVRGVVREDDGTGTLVPVELATVYLLPPGEQDPANSIATTSTAADGSYAMLGVLPGMFDVLAVKGAKQARVDGVDVAVGNVTTVDLELQ